MNNNPFTQEDLKNRCDLTLFESHESLEAKGCLMPFDDQRYNLSWGGVNPAKGMFPHGVGKHEFLKHESHKDYDGVNKNRDSGSGLGKIGKTMEFFSDNFGVFLANNNKAPKVEPPTVIQFAKV